MAVSFQTTATHQISFHIHQRARGTRAAWSEPEPLSSKELARKKFVDPSIGFELSKFVGANDALTNICGTVFRPDASVMSCRC
jgi:hypothetical protein